MSGATDSPLFLSKRDLTKAVAHLGLNADSFTSLPGAPQPVQWSPRRRRWRNREVAQFVALLESLKCI